MSRCTVCNHPQRGGIDAEIVGGQSSRSVAAQFGLSKSAVIRHAKDHIADALTSASRHVEHEQPVEDARVLLQEKQDLLRGVSIVERLSDIDKKLKEVLAKAERKGHQYVALGAIREMIRIIDIRVSATIKLSRIGAENREPPKTVVVQAIAPFSKHPQWARFKNALLRCVRSDSGAFGAVGNVLDDFERHDGIYDRDTRERTSAAELVAKKKAAMLPPENGHQSPHMVD